MVPVEADRDVDVEDVPVVKGAIVWYAVGDDVVDAGAA